MQARSDHSLATAASLSPATGLHTTVHSASERTAREPSLYQNENDRSRHLHTMARLAEEIACPIDLIEPLYEQLLAHLKQQATVHDYLPILVAKSVRHALKEGVKQH